MNATNPRYRLLVIITVMTVTILEMLDVTIVTVSLPHMMGSLGANVEQITWVLTSYIVASAIFMPLTGFLENRFGRQRMLMLCISGFLFGSMLCGIANSLIMIVFSRIIQGAFGAGLIPLSQAIMMETFPPEERNKAMGIWGMGIMVAPVLGPMLGGFITEHMNWRWIFFINLPGCIASLILTSILIENKNVAKRPIDWIGMLFMIIGFGGLQMLLDQGNQKGWFESHFIANLAIISCCAIAYFIFHSLKKPNPIINLRLFLDKNFSLATIVLAIFAGSLISFISLQAVMLERLMGYPAVTTGLLMAPRGIACAVSIGMAVQLTSKIGARSVIIAGLLLSAIGTWPMASYTVTVSDWDIIWPAIIQGLGMGFIFVPLSSIALSTIPKDSMAEGAGLFSYGRMLGNSIGISILATTLARHTQYNWNRLGGHINPYNPNLQQWLTDHHMQLNEPGTLSYLAGQLSSQGNMIAFINAAFVLAILFLLLIPLIFSIKQPQGSAHG